MWVLKLYVIVNRFLMLGLFSWYWNWTQNSQNNVFHFQDTTTATLQDLLFIYPGINARILLSKRNITWR
ncbi:hypothetical protein L6452_07931 [Arctium lappa]|uniref:Uncharacterized protein n=1 Tax=Arctium lappa TaxID=4217 RepID=A0ACB9EN05_ARCLA|nr:hypothetical protein L6452_07931 [Arctium lappa]